MHAPLPPNQPISIGSWLSEVAGVVTGLKLTTCRINADTLEELALTLPVKTMRGTGAKTERRKSCGTFSLAFFWSMASAQMRSTRVPRIYLAVLYGMVTMN